MAQIFHPSTNTIARVSIFGALVFVAGSLWLADAIHRSPYVTQASVVVGQPVPFSHKLHAGGLGLDCRHCHTSVEDAPFAGIPSTKTCMTCHSQIFTDSEVLAPVRASFAEDRSLTWTRVHDLPDFVHFDHSIHVRKGIGCVTCHGRVNEMPVVRQVATLQMVWCLDCHRHPGRDVRPADRVFDLDWVPPAVAPDEDVEPGLVRSLTSCSTCHQ